LQYTVQQTLVIAIAASSYTGATKLCAEQAYGQALGIFSTTTGWAITTPASTVTSSVSTRRSTSSAITFVAKTSDTKGAVAQTAAATLATIPSKFDVAFDAVKTANQNYANVATVTATSASSIVATGGCKVGCTQNAAPPSTSGPAMLWQGMIPEICIAKDGACWSQFSAGQSKKAPVGVPAVGVGASGNTLNTAKMFSGDKPGKAEGLMYGPKWNGWPLNRPETNTENQRLSLESASAESPACQDYDGDGDIDCVIGRADGTLIYWQNQGFNPKHGVDDMTNANQASLMPYGGHLNSSTGACTAAAQYCAPWKTPGMGNWAGAERNTTAFNSVGVGGCYSVSECVGTLWACCGGFVANQTYARPTAVDIDGDGDFDIFVGGAFGKLRFLENVGNKTSPSWRLNTINNPLKHVDVGWLSAPTFADFDGDGALDCVIGQDKGPAGYATSVKAKMHVNKYVLTEANREAQGLPQVDSSGAENAWEDKFFKEAFLDDDGKEWSDPGIAYKAELFYYKNTGTNASAIFTRQTGAVNNPMHGVQGRVPTCLDIDGDGDVDCLVSVAYGHGWYATTDSETVLRYFKNRMIETATTVPNLVEVSYKSNPFSSKRVPDPAASCVDFNGDGSIDCAVGFASFDYVNNAGVWFVNNVGTKSVAMFAEEDGLGVNPAWKDSIAGLAARYGHRMSCADFDGNGLIDCIVAREDNCVITYLNNTGTKERAQLTPLPTDKNPFLNKAVLLQANTGAGSIAGLDEKNHYNGTYCPARTLPAPASGSFIINGAMSPACADFDLDGGELDSDTHGPDLTAVFCMSQISIVW